MIRIGPASIPYVIDILKNGDEESRKTAMLVLEGLRKKAAPAVPDLIRCLLEDKSAAVRQASATCLGFVGADAEAAVPALEQAVTNDVPEVANTAKYALERIRRSSSK